ncbi:MAG: CsbD family protein [Candidatus Omnitrophica bacterium]|nr:CsbD family protein [Candidatus Omnitrophota bacterium]MCA9423451.1 CsbD family protein [Candidatus Omnitrophota bacterium]MCA9432816.1 CsbD family protein [Candidatus Omnitrophota bacterium]MCB9767507.1 CsbD family protein [Candidatus Omnitrophota bacterium]MCB9782548.1 CsbD family protein [Candidatus Omnitrophota bacterium]
MNWEQVEGNWNQVKGKAKEKWGELTSDDLDRIEGKRDQLVGTLQKKYGYAKEKAEREAEDFAGRC